MVQPSKTIHMQYLCCCKETAVPTADSPVHIIFSFSNDSSNLSINK